jgi:hypothetical protein
LASINKMKTIKMPFYHTEEPLELSDGYIIPGLFINAEEAKKDYVHGYALNGKQNKRRGTKSKHKRKIAHESRRRNRTR